MSSVELVLAWRNCGNQYREQDSNHAHVKYKLKRVTARPSCVVHMFFFQHVVGSLHRVEA
jgi:hypothetical protein